MKMISSTNESFDFINSGNSQGQLAVVSRQTDLIQALLYEIIRVKDIIKYYEHIPNGAGQLGVSILKELVTEAHNSLVNYDTMLMTKYLDLLRHCD